MKLGLQNYSLAAISLKDDLFAGKGFFRFLRVGLFLLFLLLTLWGLSLIYKFTDREDITSYLSVNEIKHSSIEDKKRLELMAQTYENILNVRKDSQKLANDIIQMKRNPMAQVKAPANIPILSPEPSLSDIDDLPPFIIIRAVMFFSGKGSAVVDIDGIGDGVVIRRGTRFSGGKGKVISIKKDRLVFKWNGKSIVVPIDL